MTAFSFNNKKVLIMGLGLQGGGVGSARFFARHGASVTVTDLKNEDTLKSSISQLSEFNIRYVLGRHDESDFLTSDLIIKNPDVVKDNPYIELAKKNNIEIEMEESLFVKLCPSKIIGITGTRGKSTVSKLLFDTLKANNQDVYLAGNMKGSKTLELLDIVDKNSLVVLELSSWQLSAFTKSPHISLITNIYPDHLNRYKSMDEYIDDKKNIFKFQNNTDYLILNLENEIATSFASEAHGKVELFSKKDWPSNEKIKLLGEHNLSNVAAVWKCLKLLGFQNEASKNVIREFSGLEYRIQKICEVNNVSFVNDSTSTTPTATIVAVNSFANSGIILLLGGNDKNLPLDELLELIRNKVKYVILLKGSGTDKLLLKINQDEELKNKFSSVYDDYEKAIRKAYAVSQKGDVVLLSPAFTSFAMFNNEFERANRFNQIALKIKDEI